MIRTVTLGFLAAFLTSLSAADSVPTLDQIAEQHRKALGGACRAGESFGSPAKRRL